METKLPYEHRKQIDLYKSYDKRIARWKMLGHTLRVTNKTPAKQATIYYFSEKRSPLLSRSP
jgi:hypothetical protein